MWRIPLSDLNFDNIETDAVLKVLKSGWLTMGPCTEEFEAAFCARHRIAHAVAVANCTCALELAYRYILKGAGPGKGAVVVPDITFVATANAVIAAGGEPLLCDISSATSPFLSINALKHLLESRTDIAAVALVHYAGYDANAEAIAELCKKHNVLLVEDCAHSPGAVTASGKLLGTIGLAGCFSFFSNKNIATGEGGMVITNDDEFAGWLRAARSHGMTSGTWSRHTQHKTGYDVPFPGYNYRCSEITAALGLAQLQKLDEGNQRRQNLTQLYADNLLAYPQFKVFSTEANQLEQAACHILPLICETANIRDDVRTALTNASIQTSHHYAPIHTFTHYEPLSNGAQFPNAVAFAGRELTLPLHPNLKPGQIEEICAIAIGAVS